MNKSFHVSLGDRGEMVAWDYLLKHGYKILEKNYRCKIGEIDVVAEKNKRIVFVEIKTRAQSYFGEPQEAVHPRKQRKLIQLAQWYLKDKKKEDSSASFDIVAVTWKGKGDPEIRLIENAISADEDIR